MTPNERAEKICEGFKGKELALTFLRQEIAAEIRAAVEEAQTEMYWQPRETVERNVRAEAYEDAAKIAEQLGCTDGFWCGNKISSAMRARAAEVGK